MRETISNGSQLQFGVFDSIEWRKSPANEIYEQRLKMAEFADQHDFFCFHVVEHHTTPLSIAPSPGIFLSAIAQRTSRIRLGPLGYLLPFYNPLRLYHEICMLDHMSEGRLELGMGRGVVPMEAERFGIETEDQGREMFNEVLDILLTAFNNDVLNYEGKYYIYKGVRLWQKPYQKPYPPLWYPTDNISNVPWMAEAGINTCNIFRPAADTREHFDLYKRTWEEHRDDPNRLNSHVKSPKMGLARNVYVAPTDRQALKECRAAFDPWMQNVGYLFDEAGISIEALDRLRDFDGLIEKEVMLVGSPQSVCEKISRTVEQSGINYLNCLFWFGDLTYEQVMRSMNLFVGEVIPSFR